MSEISGIIYRDNALCVGYYKLRFGHTNLEMLLNLQNGDVN